MKSIWDGPVLFLISGEEAKRKGRHPSRRHEPYMTQPREPMKSVWQARRKEAFANDRKILNEWVPVKHRDASDEANEESFDEEVSSKHKTALSSHSPTSSRFDMKTSYPGNLAASSHLPIFSRH